MKEIPKVFHNKINKKINNNNKIYYSTKNSNIDEKINNKQQDIRKELRNIFNSSNYIYKASVEIKTKEQTYKTKIIGRNKNYVITIDNQVILIDNIISIKKISQ